MTKRALTILLASIVLLAGATAVIAGTLAGDDGTPSHQMSDGQKMSAPSHEMDDGSTMHGSDMHSGE